MIVSEKSDICTVCKRADSWLVTEKSAMNIGGAQEPTPSSGGEFPRLFLYNQNERERNVYGKR